MVTETTFSAVEGDDNDDDDDDDDRYETHL